MKLYKCVGRHVAEIVRHCSLKVTQPNRFDDPFEFCPRLEPFDASADEILSFLGGEDKVAARLVADGYAASEADAKRLQRDPYLRITLLSRLKVVAEDHVRRHQERASAEFGIICLTENHDDFLMWSIYAQNHSVALIEFDSQVLQTECGELLQVEYRDERPRFKPMAVASDHAGFIRETIVGKSVRWKWQNEWRVLLPLSRCVQADTSPLDSYVIQVPREAITSVTFGANCPEHTVFEVMAVARASCRIKLKKAVIHDTDFSLTYNEISQTAT